MAHILTLGDLQHHFEHARDKLSRERAEILSLFPMPDDFDHDQYGLSYFRAERMGVEAIAKSLIDVAWLPMQLDPRAEIMLENREAVKKWLGSSIKNQPDGTIFGNDFIHALTRTGIIHGWDSPHFRVLAMRIGDLFHDLSCLIGLIYYGVWMTENGIEGLPVSDPADLARTAQEIERITRSPEISALLQRQKIVAQKAKAPNKHYKPILRVIENENWAQ